MSIFTPCEGGVYRVTDNCDDGGGGGKAAISISNLTGVSNVAYTGFMLELHTNQQFLHALDDFIYVFPFGDRIGEFVLTGITFLGAPCGEGASTGICGIYEHYMKNRLSKPAGRKPAQIQIGGCSPPLLGWLTGLRMELVRPELPIVQWVLRYSVIIGR